MCCCCVCLLLFLLGGGFEWEEALRGKDGALREVCEVNVVGDSVVTRPQTSHCGALVSALAHIEHGAFVVGVSEGCVVFLPHTWRERGGRQLGGSTSMSFSREFEAVVEEGMMERVVGGVSFLSIFSSSFISLSVFVFVPLL